MNDRSDQISAREPLTMRGPRRGAVLLSSLILLTTACKSRGPVPLVDHHQHLLSPALANVFPDQTAINAEILIQRLDRVGIQSAVVLSMGYFWGGPALSPKPDDEYGAVRAENDWTAEQVAKYPDRLA